MDMFEEIITKEAQQQVTFTQFDTSPENVKENYTARSAEVNKMSPPSQRLPDAKVPTPVKTLEVTNPNLGDSKQKPVRPSKDSNYNSAKQTRYSQEKTSSQNGDVKMEMFGELFEKVAGEPPKKEVPQQAAVNSVKAYPEGTGIEAPQQPVAPVTGFDAPGYAPDTSMSFEPVAMTPQPVEPAMTINPAGESAQQSPQAPAATALASADYAPAATPAANPAIQNPAAASPMAQAAAPQAGVPFMNAAAQPIQGPAEKMYTRQDLDNISRTSAEAQKWSDYQNQAQNNWMARAGAGVEEAGNRIGNAWGALTGAQPQVNPIASSPVAQAAAPAPMMPAAQPQPAPVQMALQPNMAAQPVPVQMPMAQAPTPAAQPQFPPSEIPTPYPDNNFDAPPAPFPAGMPPAQAQAPAPAAQPMPGTAAGMYASSRDDVGEVATPQDQGGDFGQDMDAPLTVSEQQADEKAKNSKGPNFEVEGSAVPKKAKSNQKADEAVARLKEDRKKKSSNEAEA